MMPNQSSGASVQPQPLYCEGKNALCGEQRCPQEKCEHYNGAGAHVVRRDEKEGA